MKIASCSIEEGFTTETVQESYILGMWRFFKEGIPPSVYKKQHKRDIMAMLHIDDAVASKAKRYSKMRDLLAKMKMGV